MNVFNLSVRRALFIFLVLLTATLACSLPGRRQQPTVYTDPIPVSTQAATELAQSVDQARQVIEQGGEFDIRLTEEQLTSAAALEIAEDPDNMLSEIRIYLREGQVQFTAQYTQGNTKLPLVVNLTVSVAPDGGLAYTISYAAIGPLPVPQVVLDQLTNELDKVLTENLTASGKEVVFEKIEIADGVLHLTGKTR